MRNLLSRAIRLFLALCIVYAIMTFHSRKAPSPASNSLIGVYKPVDPSTYSDVYPEAPDPRIREIAELMTEWYQLFIDMRYIRAENVMFPPHKHLKIDITKPAGFGFTKDVVDLYQMLPYHITEPEWNFGSDHGEFLMYGEFLADLRGPDVDWWQLVVDPTYALEDLSPWHDPARQATDGATRGWDDEGGPYIRPWYAPLTNVGNHGSVMTLDTKKYRMWLLGQLDSLGTTQDPALQGRPFTPSGSKNTNDLDQYPSRPAVEFLRDMISRYRSLEWLPGGLYGKGEVQDDEGIDRYTSFGELYKTCGWPDRFDPLKFDQLRVEGGKKFDYWESSPKGPEEDKSYAVLEHFHNPIMVQAREIIQQQIHLVDATYRLEKQMYTDKWEQQRLQAQIWNTERTLQPMKTWEEDQARLRTELDFRASDLEALRTRTGRYAGSGWAGISDAQLRGLYEKAAADKRIANINALLNDQSADERAEREYREAKQAARDAPQEAWNAFAESFATWENDNWKDRWSILGSGTTVVDLRTVLDEDLSWQDLQRRIVYELEKNEDRSWKGKRLWRNNGGRVAAVLEH